MDWEAIQDVLTAVTGAIAGSAVLSSAISDKAPMMMKIINALAFNFGKAANDPEKQ